jgi:hypothetical protein
MEPKSPRPGGGYPRRSAGLRHTGVDVADRAPASAFEAGTKAGRKVALKIVQDPRTADVLLDRGPAFRDLVPLEFAPDQFGVTDLALAVGSWPGSSGWLRLEGVPAVQPGDPLPIFPVYVYATDSRVTAGPWSAGWPELPENQRAERHRYVGTLREIIAAMADELVAAGVPVDPRATLDLAILTQLLLLDIDLAGPPGAIVERLNLLPPYAIKGDGRGVTNVRDGISRPTENASATVRIWWRSQQSDDRSETLRDRGGRPTGSTTTGSDTAGLKAHLPAVLARHSDANAGRMRREWQGNVAGSAGRMLRERMRKRVGEPAPAATTLQRLVAEAKKQLGQ